MFTPRVGVYEFKTSLSAGTIDGGMVGLPAVPGGTYHAFARLDVSVEVDAVMVFVRQLLKRTRVEVALPPMPEMRVQFCAEYVRGSVKACTVEDDIHDIHPRYFGRDGENVLAAS